MKRISILAIMSALAMNVFSQNDSIFKCNLYNEEYNVYMKINLYDNNITAPRQEIFGELPGFFGQDNDSRVWLITDAKIVNQQHCETFDCKRLRERRSYGYTYFRQGG